MTPDSSPVLDLAGLGRHEPGRDPRRFWVADVVALQSAIEIRVGSEVGVRAARRLDVRRVVDAEAPTLLTEAVIGRARGRFRHR